MKRGKKDNFSADWSDICNGAGWRSGCRCEGCDRCRPPGPLVWCRKIIDEIRGATYAERRLLATDVGRAKQYADEAAAEVGCSCGGVSSRAVASREAMAMEGHSDGCDVTVTWNAEFARKLDDLREKS